MFFFFYFPVTSSVKFLYIYTQKNHYHGWCYSKPSLCQDRDLGYFLPPRMLNIQLGRISKLQNLSYHPSKTEEFVISQVLQKYTNNSGGLSSPEVGRHNNNLKYLCFFFQPQTQYFKEPPTNMALNFM